MTYAKEYKVDIFAKEIIRGSTQTDAYKKAYPNSKHWKTATVWNEASKFASSHEVSTRIRELKDQISKHFCLEMAEILDMYKNIAFFDIAEMYDENNFVKPIHEIPIHIRRILTTIEHGITDRIKVIDGVKYIEPVTYIKRFRIDSQIHALDKLYVFKQSEDTNQTEDQSNAEVDKTQLARRILSLVYETSS